MSSPVFEIEVASHFFIVKNPNPRAMPAIIRFCQRYTLYNWVKKTSSKPSYEPVKVFATRTKDNREFRFHIGQFNDFIDFIEKDYIVPSMYTITYREMFEPVKIECSINPKYQLRDRQPEVKNFVVEESVDDNRSRLVALPTGYGKSLVSLVCAAEIGKRVLINILPTYIERWIDALKDTFLCDNKDILVIQGSNQMRDLIDLAEEGRLEAKYIILSLRTVQNYIKSYETNPYDLESEGYAVNPDQLCQHLGVGTVIIDETHQHLHAVFKFLVYTHVPKVIALSATLLSDDSTIEKIQHMMFPKEIRFDEVKMDKYIKCYAVAYGFEDMYRSKIRVNEFGSKNYSHLAFEKSLMRCKKTAGNYMDMINYLVRIGYVEHYRSGDKAIVFVATIAMANILTNYLKMKHPNLDVRRYVEDDPFENVMEADIRVTTVLSSGTAIDIPQLTCAIQTVNLKSTVSNIQSLGRLRKLKDRDVRFYFMFCEEIKKHHEYYHHRKQIFADRTVSIKDFRYPYLL